MKKTIYITLTIILAFSLSAFGQKKTVSKKTTTPPTTESPVPTVETSKPEQKVSIELTNGDKISGMFISGDTKSITIQVSSSPIKFNFDEIRTVHIGEETQTTVVDKKSLKPQNKL